MSCDAQIIAILVFVTFAGSFHHPPIGIRLRRTAGQESWAIDRFSSPHWIRFGISTAAGKNAKPQRDCADGIIATLVVCTLLLFGRRCAHWTRSLDTLRR